MTNFIHWTTVDDSLLDAGITHFTGREVCHLQNARARRRVGAQAHHAKLPERLLKNALALGLYLEIIRDFASEISGRPHPIKILGWYRPGRSDSLALGYRDSYNKAAGGTGISHELAAAADIRSGIGRHDDLGHAVLRAWTATVWGSGVGNYAWGRRHVDVVVAGNILARQWCGSVSPLLLKGGDVRRRVGEQVARIGEEYTRRSGGPRRRAIEVDIDTVIDDLRLMHAMVRGGK